MVIVVLNPGVAVFGVGWLAVGVVNYYFFRHRHGLDLTSTHKVAIAQPVLPQEVVRNPLHPYARGLMGAIPTLAGEDKRLVQIPGSMPRLSAIPAGCPFNPRCAFVFDRCRVERPEPIRQGTQSVACHLFEPAKETAA